MESLNLRSLSPLLVLLLCSLMEAIAIFSPQDNYLLNCGSSSNATLFNRDFLGDSSEPGSRFLFSDRSVSVKNNKNKNNNTLYNTARVFNAVSSYKFRIRRNGTHILRFHFSPFSSLTFALASANFTLSVPETPIVLKRTSINNAETEVKEFILKIEKNSLEIVFTPIGDSGNSFAYVNAIEVFSAPDDLIVDYGAKLVNSQGAQEYKNLSSRIFETVHRVNVGGPKLTPFNDTLWRTWLPDGEFLVLKSAAMAAVSLDPPNYQKGGSTREIAPDNVYMTAREMNKTGVILDAKFNLTWKFPVLTGTGRGSRYLVRLHFCDIVSTSLNQLYFCVYVNGFSAYRDLDLSTMTSHVLASPIYIDFLVDVNDDLGSESSLIDVSVGPSDLSGPPSRINAILNGAEIMRMVFPDSESPGEGNSGSRKRTFRILLGSILGGGLFLCAAVFATAFFCLIRVRKIRRRKSKPRPVGSTTTTGWTPLRTYGGSSLSRMSEGTGTSPNGAILGLKIPFADLIAATNGFDKSLIIGSGGFGIVYKGTLRDGTHVAVKRGMPGSRQGLPEFQAEIAVLSRIRHLHLVSLVGYCEEQAEMILVYEFMEKGTLRNHLYGSRILPALSWRRRLEICIGAARGLHYLHTGSAQGIIHRDIKSTNILLDENYVAKVADFGLSRSGPCLDETHVSTGVKGSFGYLDPEYFRRQQLTDKSDVYSFGVVLFEVLCARPAVDPLLTREQVNLAEWALQWQRRGTVAEIVDRRLALAGEEIKPSSLKKFGETAEKCLAEYGVDRPTMGDVLWNLEYALQLQEAEPRRDLDDDDDDDDDDDVDDDSDGDGDGGEDEHSIVVDDSTGESNNEVVENTKVSSSEVNNGSSGVSGVTNTSRVFSQLLNKNGR